MERAAMAQVIGCVHDRSMNTGIGMTTKATQILVHQGQCARYEGLESGPHLFTTQRR